MFKVAEKYVESYFNNLEQGKLPKQDPEIIHKRLTSDAWNFFKFMLGKRHHKQVSSGIVGENICNMFNIHYV